MRDHNIKKLLILWHLGMSVIVNLSWLRHNKTGFWCLQYLSWMGPFQLSHMATCNIVNYHIINCYSCVEKGWQILKRKLQACFLSTRCCKAFGATRMQSNNSIHGRKFNGGFVRANCTTESKFFCFSLIKVSSLKRNKLIIIIVIITFKTPWCSPLM